MKRNLRLSLRSPAGIDTTSYPWPSMALAMILIYLTPFVSSLCSLLAFVICIWRLVRYDAKVFSVDYCILIPVSLIFRTSGGMALLVYVILIAAALEILRSGIRGDISYVMVIVLLNYLVTRMQLSVNNFLLCFGPALLMCVMLPKQDEASAERAAKAFCISLFISSCYALIFRNTWQIQAVRGTEPPAFLGSTLRRFQGLFQDPNYYMSLLILGMALMIKLRESRRTDAISFWIITVSMAFFGILSYSKSFFLLLVVLVMFYIFWQFRERKFGWGVFLVATLVLGSGQLLFSPESPFAVVIYRFLSAKNISDLTTGRTEVYQAYFEVITRDPFSLFFGQGMAADALSKDPHNLFLEITYYTGLTGLVVFIGFYWSLIYTLGRKLPTMNRQSALSKYLVLIMAVGLFCTLHGMFSFVSYAIFYLASLAMIMTKKTEVANG